jgi:tetratricopeptide (TPR) repeat protein
MEQGKIDEAKNAFADARKANPDDVSLIISEANLYYNQGDFVTYKKIIEEAAAKNPTNPELFYNLGVAAIKTNDYKQAEAYYLKAIELNPKYADAYYNISILKIDADVKIVEEMNGLGNTPKDNARYNVLKGEREKVFKEALPYLEKAVELNDSNVEAKKTLLNIYSMLDMTDKYKALKAKI